jgi:hypothetical protein
MLLITRQIVASLTNCSPTLVIPGKIAKHGNHSSASVPLLNLANHVITDATKRRAAEQVAKQIVATVIPVAPV